MSDPFLARVLAAIRRESLLDGLASLWVAVSGGADSVALLHALHSLCRPGSPNLRVLHVNHGLRGGASDADAEFVCALGAGLGLPVTVRRVCIPAPGSRQGDSLEMAARRARLDAYRSVCAHTADAALATGHHADDVAETLLLRLGRGSGMRGLAALRPRSQVGDLSLIRPLIDCSRDDIRNWLRARRLAWREDLSNADARMRRNRLRHETLPWLETHGMPGLRDALVRSAVILRDEDVLLRNQSLEAWNRCRCIGEPASLSAAHLRREPPALQRRVLLEWLWSEGVPEADFNAVERVLALAAEPRGTRWTPLRGGVMVIRAYDRLSLAARASFSEARNPLPGLLYAGPAVARQPRRMVANRRQAPFKFCPRFALPEACREPLNPVLNMHLPEPETVRRRVKFRGCEHLAPSCVSRLPGGLRLRAWLAPWSPRSGQGQEKSGFRFQTALNAAVWAGRPLSLRAVRPGDRMRPSGLSGTRKLQDLWVDAKIPQPMRPALPLLLHRDTIVWAPGLRPVRGWIARRGIMALWLRVEKPVDSPPLVSV